MNSSSKRELRKRMVCRNVCWPLDWPRSALYRETSRRLAIVACRPRNSQESIRCLLLSRPIDRCPSVSMIPPLPPSNLPISLLPVLVSFLADVSRFFARPPRITNPGHQFIPLPRRRLTNRILTSNFELSRTLKPPRPQRSPLRPLLYTYRYTRHEYTHYIY